MTSGAELAQLAQLGPFFALDTYPVGAAPFEGWRPLEELLGQPGVLEAQVAVVRAALAEASGRHPDEVEPRVAASMTQLGLAARLICPALGMAVLTGRLLRVDAARMRWRPGPGGAVALSIRDDALAPAGSAAVNPAAFDDMALDDMALDDMALADMALADALAGTVIDGPVRALVEAGARLAVSPQVLWGNVASVLNSARTLVGAVEPALLEPTDQLVSRLLSRPPLHGTHQGSAAAGFRRRSCCLMYRLAPAQAPVCGDCVLDRGPALPS
ncbi:MAG: (2Fe-2S)-binding protein [Jatrophihabitantaceae bacterium]